MILQPKKINNVVTGFLAVFIGCIIPYGQGFANDVEIVNTQFELRAGSWHVNTTLRHGDTGWSHYADAWRVVTEKGEDLGTRTLYHPHEQEQPFTRSHTVNIPKGTNIVYVEAHDKVHGWSKKRVKVDLRKASGDRFKVQR